MSAPQDEVRFVLLPADCLAALLESDLQRASSIVGVELPTEFLDGQWLWQIRLDQMRQDPTSAPWLARATVRVRDGTVIGRAGFHGPPDDSGMVEIGYEVNPAYRGQGLGKATARALIDEAWSSPRVHRVRASVCPDNAPSLAIVRGLGFEQVGEQIDEIDGLELVFELAAPHRD